MDHRDIRALLDSQKFQPFELVLNNGERFRVRYPRLAIVSRTALFLFSSRDGKIVDGAPLIVALRNISQIEPVGRAA